jgi:arylsulfatase A-like enzyme
MLTDNLGYGDVGAYGGGAVRGAPTQHIDTLASEGLQLTNFSAERATIVKLLQQVESRTISTALV